MSIDQRVIAHARQGTERFTDGSSQLDFTVNDFWRWSASDLLSNTMRGVLAEYVVAQALGIASDTVRTEWEPFDLRTQRGGRIEVKSSAYLQTWSQRALSTIRFRVPSTRPWDADSGLYGTERRRQADIYIFAVLVHVDKLTVNPLDVSQWEFYVIPTDVINTAFGTQKTLTLGRLQTLTGAAIPYSQLGKAIERLECGLLGTSEGVNDAIP